MPWAHGLVTDLLSRWSWWFFGSPRGVGVAGVVGTLWGGKGAPPRWVGRQERMGGRELDFLLVSSSELGVSMGIHIPRLSWGAKEVLRSFPAMS